MAECSNIVLPSESGGSLTCAQLEAALVEVRNLCNETTGLKPFAWYEGGDDFRVYATYDPFATGYTKNGAGDYLFVVPAGDDIAVIEFVHNETGGTINVTGGGSTIISINTANNGGNTNSLNGSKADGAYYDIGNNYTKTLIGSPISGGLQLQHAWAAGVLTLTITSANTMTDGSPVVISNLSQKH